LLSPAATVMIADAARSVKHANAAATNVQILGPPARVPEPGPSTTGRLSKRELNNAEPTPSSVQCPPALTRILDIPNPG
jgi:hypothetical protein